MPMLINEPLHEAVPLQNYPLPIPALPAPRAVPSRSAVAKVWIALPSRYHAEWSHATLCLAMPLHCLTHLCPYFVSLDLAHAVSYGTELCRCYAEPTSPCLALASRHDTPRNLASAMQNSVLPCLGDVSRADALPSCICVVICLCYA